MSDNAKVSVAAVVGTGSPITIWFFENAEPVLQVLLMAGQLGVAVVTILYIYRKWQNSKTKK